MIVLALTPSPEARARLRDGLPRRSVLHFCDRATQLPAHARRVGADVVIVEPLDADGNRVSVAIRLLRRDAPQIAIAVFCALTPENARELVALIKNGADEIILRGYDDPARWLAGRDQAGHWRQTSLEVLRLLAPQVSGDVRDVLEYALREAPQIPTVAGAAESLGVSRKTLVNRLAAAGLPTPRALMAWCRLLIALQLLETDRCSVESVAHAMRFGSSAALRKMCRRYTGLRHSELRALGGMAHALSLFVAEFASPPLARDRRRPVVRPDAA